MRPEDRSVVRVTDYTRPEKKNCNDRQKRACNSFTELVYTTEKQ